MAKKPGNPSMRKGAPSVNPSGKAKLDANPGLIHRDGWMNVITGANVAEYDKRLGGVPFCTDVPYADAQAIWRGDDVGKRAVEIPAEDMIRQGFDFVVDAKDDKKLDTLEIQEKVEKVWKDLNVFPAFKEALMKRDAYGGAAILVGAKDSATDLTTPLGKVVREVSFLNVFDRSEIVPYYYYANPREANYGKPAVYLMTPQGTGQPEDGEIHQDVVLIHESRLLVFNGHLASNQLSSKNDGWGDSIYVQMQEVLRDFNAAWNGTGVLVQEFGYETIKLQGLNALLCTTDGEKNLITRLNAIALAKSTIRAKVVDKEDECERSADSLSGLPEILEAYMGRMSSAARGIPISKLFGIAPSGLNASGASDITQWDDRVKSMQVDGVIPNLEKLTRILLGSLKVKAKEWTITARPLRQQTDDEKSATRKTVAETDVMYINAGVLSADEVAKSRFGGDIYSLDTVVDFDERERLEADMTEETPNTKQATEPGKPASAEPGADKAKEQE